MSKIKIIRKIIFLILMAGFFSAFVIGFIKKYLAVNDKNVVIPEYILSGNQSHEIAQQDNELKFKDEMQQRSKDFNSSVGEKIVYDVKMGMVNIGQAVFQNLSMEKLDGKDVNLITFETRLARMYDLEKIYTDPDNYLPLKVERLIKMWPKNEEILELYDQNNFNLKIINKHDGKESVKEIKKDKQIHNSILLPFVVRKMANLDIGWSLDINLPRQQFVIKVVSKEEIEVPAGKFKTFYLESEPKKIQIWISQDDRKIPVKIKGTGALGYILVMKEYTKL